MTDNTIGMLWALCGASLVGVTSVLLSRPLREIGTFAAMILSNSMNVLVLAAIGWWTYRPERVSLEGLLWFALLGVTSYSCGRFSSFKAIVAIGPSHAATLKSTAPLLALVPAVVFLGERPGSAVLGGTAMVVLGVFLVSYEPTEENWFQRGTIWGFLTALAVALSMFIRKKGLAAMPDPVLTASWANLVSLPIVFGFRPFVSPSLFHWGGKKVVIAILALGAVNALNQIVHNLAVFRSDISVVTPILTSSPIFALFAAAVLVRDIERIRPAMVLGVLLTVGGLIFIALGRR